MTRDNGAVKGGDEDGFLDMDSILKEIAEQNQENVASDVPGGVADQTAVIQKVADSVAHELNNVLATVIGLASVIETETDPDSPTHQDIQGILSAAKRGIQLTRNLLGFSKNGSVAFKESIDLHELLGKALGLLKRTASREISIETDLDNDIAVIQGDPSQIRHVLINLTSNAVDAMQGKGTLTITTRNVEVEEGKLGDLPGGSYVRLQVADTGRGMDRETVKHAFDPFFTTKPTASGLGLPLVHRIVSNHRGKIDLFSRTGLGTTVTVHLPVSGRPRKPTDRDLSQVSKRSGTMLLVDDDPLVRASAGRILRMMGYSVIMASDGQEALDRFKAHQDTIRAVLLDLIMPEMDGGVVLDELKKIDPEVRVIISSGYTRDEPVQRILDRGAMAFIEKPYTVKQLASTIDRVLA